VAFALTEPNAGSDAGAIQTTARKEGDYYVLNGTKIFITNGGEADIYTVVALTNPEKGARGASMFIVEKGTPGFEFGKKEDKMGIRASATRELIFNECKVPKENLLGREGAGFLMTMKVFDISRPGVAAQALGIAEGAFEEALKYVHQRHQFGKSIIANQGVQWMLADMATSIETARALIYQVADMIDRGETKDIGYYSAMAKMYASDVAMRVTTDAVQLFGGYGYMREYPVEKMMRENHPDLRGHQPDSAQHNWNSSGQTCRKTGKGKISPLSFLTRVAVINPASGRDFFIRGEDLRKTLYLLYLYITGGNYEKTSNGCSFCSVVFHLFLRKPCNSERFHSGRDLHNWPRCVTRFHGVVLPVLLSGFR